MFTELNQWRSSSTHGNRVVKIEDYDSFLTYWPFFLRGHEQLTKPNGANMADLTVQELFKTLLELSVYPERGFLALLVNKRGLPLGYLAAHDTTIAFRPKELTVFAIYTNDACPVTTRELMFELKQWAKGQDYKVVKAIAYKASGASLRFFNLVLQLRKTGLVWSVKL